MMTWFKQFSPQHKAILLALTGFSAFSFSDAGAKWLTQSYSTYQTVTTIQICSLIVLLCFSSKLGAIRTLWDADAKANAKIHLLRAALNASITASIVYAFTQLPLTSIYTAIFTKPFIAAILAAILFSQTLGKHRLIAITIGFTGVLVAFRPWEQSLPLNTSLILLALPTMIALMFLATRWLKGGSLLAMAFWPVVGSTIANAALMFVNEATTPIDTSHIPIFAATACFSSLGVVCVSRAFQTGDAAAISPMVYVEFLWAIGLGYALFNDLPTPQILLGAAIIITSGLYLIWSESRKK